MPAATKKSDPENGVSFSLTAAAKINLYLHVLGRRPDGYHLLDSLVAFAGFGDHVSVSHGADLRLAIAGPFAGALVGSDDNIVARAARLLADEGGVPAKATIRLDKRIPVAAGLGGGSADAAAALRVLATLWELQPADDDLLRLGIRLGADVPICLRGQASFVGGIGDTLFPAPALPPAYLVLVNPGGNLSTARVYGALNKTRPTTPKRFVKAPETAPALAQFLAGHRNDLEDPAQRIEPHIRRVLTVVSALQGCLLARMSGSGATCFGLFADLAAAEAATERIEAEHGGWWVVSAPLVYRTAVAEPIG